MLAGCCTHRLSISLQSNRPQWRCRSDVREHSLSIHARYYHRLCWPGSSTGQKCRLSRGYRCRPQAPWILETPAVLLFSLSASSMSQPFLSPALLARPRSGSVVGWHVQLHASAPASRHHAQTGAQHRYSSHRTGLGLRLRSARKRRLPGRYLLFH